MKQKLNLFTSKSDRSRQKRADKMVADVQAGILKVYSGRTALTKINQQDTSVSPESTE